MTNKLTDSEIVKALECISGKAKDWDCDKCAFDGAICTSYVSEKALDLFNRLQAENERLKANLNIELEEFASEYDNKIKAEAYKECIEKVKSELKNIAKIDWQDNYYYLVGTAFFDNLLKELVGDDNG